ncbi:MAG TPA: MucR family transcriptional regulator, partial [Azospirillum sp.]|nr:MucR family transcriptional regulator [Azospirillum sp.]
VCLECGKKNKMLKRHLASEHGLTPVEYRSKWGLPSDYPMTAPEYAAQRSELAKSIGLGRGRGQGTGGTAAPSPAPTKGRRKKAA